MLSIPGAPVLASFLNRKRVMVLLELLDQLVTTAKMRRRIGGARPSVLAAPNRNRPTVLFVLRERLVMPVRIRLRGGGTRCGNEPDGAVEPPVVTVLLATCLARLSIALDGSEEFTIVVKVALQNFKLKSSPRVD